MQRSLEIRFSADHPTGAGHFPGNPIIPGAVLLDEILTAVSGEDGMAGAVRIRAAKFLHPVRPGERVLIRWTPNPGGEVKFECLLLDPERTVLTGIMQCDAGPT